MKLGKREIDAAECPPGKQDALFFDDELTGFSLRVSATGAKTFLFQYRRGSAVHRVRIGRYGDITPAQARRRAEKLRGDVADGRHPAAELRDALDAEAAAAAERKRSRQAEAYTFARLVTDWETEHLAHRSDRHRTEAPRALRLSLADLAELPAGTIDATTARRAIEAIPRRTAPAVAAPSGAARSPAPGPARGLTMARRVRAYARAMYAWGIKQGKVTGNPFAVLAPIGVEKSRERALSDAELGEVWQAAGGLGWPWAQYIRFLLLTLQRAAETAGMCWAELAADQAQWEIPGGRTKNGKPHIVHLAPAARSILVMVPRTEGSPLVFTTTGSTPISGFSAAKERLDRAIAKARTEAAAATGRDPVPMPGWRLHDFRRTGVTALARLGTRWEVADRLLNHTHGAIRGVAAVYQRHEFLDERRAAMTAWAEHVTSLGDPSPLAGNVVQLRPGGRR